MSPIQQMLLGAGSAVAPKNYIDDVFSTFLYAGNSSTQSISNSVDLTEGGMVWIKNRTSTYDNQIYDTVRGIRKRLKSNNNAVEDTETHGLTSFTGTGFTLGSNANANNTGQDFTSWTFRKSPMFDVIQFSGNSVNNRQISHNLGSNVGMVIVKATDSTDDWVVWHRDLSATGFLKLNTTSAEANHDTIWGSSPSRTSTYFTVGTSGRSNQNGQNYIAYVFAGGESTNALARSVDFDGNDYLNTTSSSSDFTMGTGDFTVECWAKPNANSSDQPLFQISDTSGGFKSSGYASTLTVWHRPNGQWVFCTNGSEQNISGFKPAIGVWYHMALVRNSGTTSLYVNGTKIKSATDSTNYNGTYFVIGGYYSGSYIFNGKISNFRVVKGTAVYTSSFKPTYEPLTNITNTKLLCCNNSSTTGSTVSPVTITANGNPTASTDSPFDDPAGFVFGDAEDQNVIKCSGYKGSGSAGLEVNIGWEPQWVLIKDASAATSWRLLDSMRGITTGGDEKELFPDGNYAEVSNDRISLTSTGFILTSSGTGYNVSGNNYIFCAIRRSDGYCGKPPSLGTDVFNLAYGQVGPPSFASGFVSDWTIHRAPSSGSQDWHVQSRLTGPPQTHTNNTDAESTYAPGGNPVILWDFMNGYGDWGASLSAYVGYHWKRSASFDCIVYKGNGVAGHQIRHNLSKPVEMIIIKRRNTAYSWLVGHKGLNGGSNPWHEYIFLNDTGGDLNYEGAWNDSAPTSTHFTLGSHLMGNGDNDDYIAMLFASVDKISSVGSYSGSSSAVTLDLGFQPRFIMIKRYNSAGTGWFVFDTLRGINTGNDPYLRFDSNAEQVNTQDWVDLTTTGITINHGMTGGHGINDNGDSYVYYAHS